MSPFSLHVLLFLFLLVTTALAAPNELLQHLVRGQMEQVYHLLAQGAPPDQAEHPSGWTPLIYAANAGDLQLSRALLASGADVNKGCADGWTPLMFACVRGHLHIIQLFLEHGANIHVVSPTGATALGSAKLGGNSHAVRMIEDALSASRLHQVIFEKDKGVEAVILSASFSGDYQLVERLLREGHSPNTVSAGGWTPLMLAAAGGSIPTMRVLLRMGAAVDEQDLDGWTALMFSAHAANIPGIVLLLEAQADIFLTNKDNATVLGLTRAEGHVDAYNMIVGMTYCHELLTENIVGVQSMIDDGVDPNAIDCTETFVAMKKHEEEMARRSSESSEGSDDSQNVSEESVEQDVGDEDL